ncbi:unnamed protein product [Protopolystoma xenopodis]|uniref:Uncharacterized protein n=1 Tax=Protopolystoma xenopodis TaxID=117903 RepID=A0A448XRL8_9PLAT|nr:unnamed protein product [Protopolystoma xenopodis]
MTRRRHVSFLFTVSSQAILSLRPKDLPIEDNDWVETIVEKTWRDRQFFVSFNKREARRKCIEGALSTGLGLRSSSTQIPSRRLRLAEKVESDAISFIL